MTFRVFFFRQIKQRGLEQMSPLTSPTCNALVQPAICQRSASEKPARILQNKSCFDRKQNPSRELRVAAFMWANRHKCMILPVCQNFSPSSSSFNGAGSKQSRTSCRKGAFLRLASSGFERHHDFATPQRHSVPSPTISP
jgi:hypothetical protein